MDENAKKVVDSIMEVINASEVYSFEENPAPVFNILLSLFFHTLPPKLKLVRLLQPYLLTY